MNFGPFLGHASTEVKKFLSLSFCVKIFVIGEPNLV